MGVLWQMDTQGDKLPLTADILGRMDMGRVFKDHVCLIVCVCVCVSPLPPTPPTLLVSFLCCCVCMLLRLSVHCHRVRVGVSVCGVVGASVLALNHACV